MQHWAQDENAIEIALRSEVAALGPNRLRRAIEDAVLGGGARVRPRLCLAISRAASGLTAPPELARAAATAIELLHCASLVHDDLPCFDDAPTRRGRPSIHRAYGEATAVLVGDALIVASFDVLARAGAPADAVATLARSAGAQGGLVSGQASELEDGSVDLGAYHAGKTASLFEAAAALGAISVGAPRSPYAELGRSLGLFYQAADDAADRFGDATVLGKPTARDAAKGCPNIFASCRREIVGRTLRRAAQRTLDAVPEGPGRRELRAFVSTVLSVLIVRSGVEAVLEGPPPASALAGE